MAWTGQGEPLRSADWEVRQVNDKTADRLVARLHYAGGSAKQSCYLHGLFEFGEPWDENCMGVAHWLPPTRAVGKCLLPSNPNGVLSLSRLCVEPSVPGNGATFLMARSMRRVDRARWPVLVTYADEMQGHTGRIYLATGWAFDGVTKPKAAWRRNGRLISTRNGTRTRTHAEMLAIGAELVGHFKKLRFVHRLT